MPAVDQFLTSDVDQVRKDLWHAYHLSAAQIDALPGFVSAVKIAGLVIPSLFMQLKDHEFINSPDYEWYRRYTAYKDEGCIRKMSQELHKKYAKLSQQKFEMVLVRGVCANLHAGYGQFLENIQMYQNDKRVGILVESNQEKCIQAYRTICTELVKSRNQETGLSTLGGILRQHWRIPPDVAFAPGVR